MFWCERHLSFLRSFWGFALRASLSARNWGNMKSFSSYAETRQKLAEQCDIVEAAWTSATTASEFEQIAGGNTQDAEASASEVADLIARKKYAHKCSRWQSCEFYESDAGDRHPSVGGVWTWGDKSNLF